MKKPPMSKSFNSWQLNYDLKMKLSLLFFLTVSFLMQANSYSQKTKISIEKENSTVREVLDEIENLSEFKFLFKTNSVDLNRKVTIQLQKVPVAQVLDDLFKDSNISYEIDDRKILLKRILQNQLNKDEVFKIETFQRTVIGTITDSDGVPLAGANIVEKGTTNGVTADFDGNFSIDIANINAVITISYIGYATKDEQINGRNNLSISLQESAAGLDEVVVIGYGSQKEALLTGSVGTVKSEEIQKVSYANTAGVLQGRVPGVKVETNGGAPGAGVNVVIRGTGSFGNDQPLFVIDGNIVESMSFLNPNDIETISVLKDASSAAIYGSRAANGVVLITTKKGAIGDVAINFETKLGFQTPTKYLDYLNAREYADYHNMAKDNDGDPRAIPNDTGFNPEIDTDWQDLSLNPATYKEYSLNVSGGSDQARFYISGQLLDQEGIVVDSDFKRYNLTANTNFKKGRFSLSQSLLLSREEYNPNNFFNKAAGAPPTIPVYDDSNEGGFAGVDPNLYGLARGVNWYGVAILNDNLITTDRLVGSIQPELKLSKSLNYKMNLGIDYSLLHNYAFQPTFFQSTSTEASVDIASLNENYVRSLSTLIENTLEYSNSFGKHGVNLLVGHTMQSIKARSAGGIGTNFIFNDFRVLDAADDNTDNTIGNLNENSLESYLGRLSYDYDGKYILNATIRRDGSSRFTDSNRWGTFPSASLGWRVSKENFFPEDAFMSNLKLRASYGELGSQNIGNYQTSSVLNTSNFYNLGGTVYNGSIVTNLANSKLKWETTKMANYGIDTEFLNGKIGLSVEYYTKRSEDILVNVPIPLHGGLGTSLTNNAATIENKGFEFTGTYRHVTPDNGFNYDVVLNFNIVNNEVVALGDGVNPISGGIYTNESHQATRTDIGQPVASFYGLLTEGVYQTQAELDADGRTNAVLGDLNFVDLDNDGDIDDDDQTYLGSAIPDFEFGFTFNCDYKNFDLSIFVQGVQGNEIWNGLRHHNVLDAARGLKTVEAANAWTPQNTNTSVPRATVRDLGQNSRPSDFLVEDGSYIRLKTLQLGYTFPSEIVSKISLKNLRFYISGQNILTFTDYTGYDPEIGRPLDGNGSLFDGGVDRRAYPNSKNLMYGVQIGF
tara:strand:+ start:2192 stop:5554 length:3363 start_codon:yes stop_codon:yes gene_type:complete